MATKFTLSVPRWVAVNQVRQGMDNAVLWWDGDDQLIVRVKPPLGIGPAICCRRTIKSPKQIYSPLWRDLMSDALRRAQEARKQAQNRDTQGSFDPTFQSDYPVLWQFLTVKTLDGQPRETSTLTLTVENGTWKAALNDRQNQQSLWVSSSNQAELLSTLELALQDDIQDWRAWTQRSFKTSHRGKRGS